MGGASSIRKFAVAIEPGETKVQNLDLSGRGDDDIGRLDVAMDDAAIVRMCQGSGDLRAIPHNQLRAQALRGDQRIERGALDKLHHDEMAAAGFAHFVDGADMRIVQAGGGSRFAEEFLFRVGAALRIQREDF